MEYSSGSPPSKGGKSIQTHKNTFELYQSIDCEGMLEHDLWGGSSTSRSFC